MSYLLIRIFIFNYLWWNVLFKPLENAFLPGNTFWSRRNDTQLDNWQTFLTLRKMTVLGERKKHLPASLKTTHHFSVSLSLFHWGHSHNALTLDLNTFKQWNENKNIVDDSRHCWLPDKLFSLINWTFWLLTSLSIEGNVIQDDRVAQAPFYCFSTRGGERFDLSSRSKKFCELSFSKCFFFIEQNSQTACCRRKERWKMRSYQKEFTLYYWGL